MNAKEERQVLEDFIINNPDLEELESKIAEFNIFEALGAIRQELRHSDFLAFVLNPSEKHGLGDKFLKRFLMRVLSQSEADVSAIEIDLMNLSNVIVQRESQNIDILIHDASQGFVCIIENKIYSYEHSDQLNRYLLRVRERFPTVQTLIPIFLSPEGVPPQDEDSPYIPVDYGLVSQALEYVRKSNETSLGSAINTMIEHYVTMLRRHIVSDSDIAELCRKIYRKHQAALDLIFQHKPDIREPLSNLAAELVKNHPELHLEASGITDVRFYPHTWTEIEPLQTSTSEWPQSNLLIRMGFAIWDRVALRVTIGPGTVERTREELFNHIQRQGHPFRSKARLGKKWSTIYQKILLRPNQVENISEDELLILLEENWNSFVEKDLADITATIEQFSFDGNMTQE